MKDTHVTLLSKLLLAVAAIAVALLVSPVVSAQNVQERYTGFAINLNGGPSTARVDFTIERWSTDAERDQLLAIIRENKDPTKKLLEAVQKLPKVGSIRRDTRLAWDLHFARENPLDDGGRQIVLGTDRPIGFAEARNLSRTLDYPFTIVDVHFDKSGKGQGKILAGTKIYIDKKNNLVLENWGLQPVRFNEVEKVK